MPAVTKEFLIQSMHAYPTTEREIGFNSAMIIILKELAGVTVQSNERQLTTDEQLLRGSINNDVLFYAMPKIDIDEIIKLRRESPPQKLSAVRKFKDITGMGLKESKDIIDTYFETININKYSS